MLREGLRVVISILLCRGVNGLAAVVVHLRRLRRVVLVRLLVMRLLVFRVLLLLRLVLAVMLLVAVSIALLGLAVGVLARLVRLLRQSGHGRGDLLFVDGRFGAAGRLTRVGALGRYGRSRSLAALLRNVRLVPLPSELGSV